MKISYNWLSQYIYHNLSVEKLADVITNVGLEVEGIEKFETVKGGLEGLIVAHVIECEKHPDADRLKITKLDNGTGNILQVVCGASNVAVGQKVVLATVGATLYPVSGEPFTIKKSKIRGASSEGMICAEDEIGLGASHEGIIVLPETAIIGSKVSEIYKPYKDYTIEVAITPNRGDAMSHIGIARDVSAWLSINGSTDSFIKNINANVNSTIENEISIEIENDKACRRYAGITLQNILVKESPDWLQNYLKAIGMKPINNIVDITNYVMLEMGQPLHAFDADKISGKKIIIKNLSGNTSFTTLDNKELKLNADDLMICDETSGMCIAGVYGGLNSGVSANTKNIFIESAWFDSISIRKTSNRHQLRTDAALRFEKVANIDNVIPALMRAASLIAELNSDIKVSKVSDVYPQPIEHTTITLSYKRLNDCAGYTISQNQVDTILITLGFVKIDGNELNSNWKVPAYKNDCTIEEDLIEEVMRINGYEKIPLSETVHSSLSYTNIQVEYEKYINHILNFLSSCSYNEVQNNSLFSLAETEKIFPDSSNNIVKLLSFSNSGLDSLRFNFLLPLLNTVRNNINRKHSDLKLFEYGKIYSKHNDSYQEKDILSILITGITSEEHWRNKSVKSDFFHLKSIAEAVFKKSAYTSYTVKETSSNIYSYALNYDEKNENILSLGEVNNLILKEYDIKQAVYYAEINIKALFNIYSKYKVQYRESSKYPNVRRDLALLLPKSVKYETVEKIAFQFGSKQLKSVNLFDIYEDKKLGEGIKSYAVSFIFNDDTKTLLDTEIEEKMNKLIQQFETQLQATIRK